MSDEQVNIEVNGVPMKARKGQMIIQVTDAQDVYIPRFCYHEKLTIAASCRMCLVEVEKAPKPMPACATPVAEGMKVFTKSPKAIAAQRSALEFLLINHPLDCPICDQAGECELQDLALGFGRSVSRYTERKRVVKDKSIGPLISTDMTRCIHCTRCVRFTQDIQGYQELAALGRAEMTEIGTYIQRNVDHELSANIIDLCPVGALNNKPFRYRARAWEMTQHPLISPHDAVGTNIYAHVLRGQVMRIVPRPNEEVNENWIADRDRFGYQGIYSEDRLHKPMLRIDGVWRESDWEGALQEAARRLARIIEREGAARLGALAAPGSTIEELYLLARLVRGLGSGNLDHRLRRRDFRDQDGDPLYPALGCTIAQLQQADSVLVVGSNLRKEVPLIAHRLRKAALAGGRIAFINSHRYEYMFPVAGYLAADTPTSSASSATSARDAAGRLPLLLAHLLGVTAAVLEHSGKAPPAMLAALLEGMQPSQEHRSVARQLCEGERRLILLGAIAQRHRAFSGLRRIAAALAQLSGAVLGYLPEGGNAVGASLAGVLPHRGAAGRAAEPAGLDLAAMLAARLPAYVVLGAIEPAQDIAAETALAALQAAECVVALSPYASAQQYADIILPIGTFAETSGTYVNLEGRWQSVPGAASPVGESRPGWKVLRVLANLLGLPGFEYTASDQITQELRELVDQAAAFEPPAAAHPESIAGLLEQVPGNTAALDIGIYRIDAIVRRSSALQATSDGRQGNEAAAQGAGA